MKDEAETEKEYWDLFDAARRPCGRLHRRGEPVPKGFYHQVVHLAVFNKQNELLTQQRQTSKKSWAGLWDVSLGGSVKAGESSEEGLRRETKEELGLVLPEGVLHPVLTIHGPHYFDDYYVLRMELEAEKLQLQASEVMAVRWRTQAEVSALLAKGDFVPYHPAFLSWLFDFGNGLATENFYAPAYWEKVGAGHAEDIRCS